MKKRTPFLLALIPILIGGGIVAMRFFDYGKGKPEFDSPLIVTTQPSSLVFYTMKQERSRGRPLPEGNVPSASASRRRSSSSYDYNRYTLHVLDPATGKPARLPLILAQHGSISTVPQPELFGATSTHLYLYANGLRAYKLPDLTPIFTEDQAAALRPSSGGGSGTPLSDDLKNYRVIPALDALVIRGNDALYYTLNPATAKLDPLPEEKLAPLFRSNKASDGFSFSPNPNLFRRLLSTSDILHNEVDLAGKHFTLLASDERKSLTESASHDNAGLDAARILHVANLLPPDPNERPSALDTYFARSKSRRIDLTTVTPVSEKRFIRAGILFNFSAHYDTWAPYPDLLVQDNSFLILSRASLDESAPYELTRISAEGKTLYSVTLPLADILNVAITNKGDIALFTGYPNRRQPLSTRPLHIVTINTLTGAFTTQDPAAQ